jgi:two-component system, NtrC family, sensor histidine kinase PilS
MRLPAVAAVPMSVDDASVGGVDEGFTRLWRGFMAARIFVALVLLMLMGFLSKYGTAPMGRELILCSAYLALTCWVRFVGKPAPAASRFDPQWLVTVGIDVIVFSALLHYQVGALNFTPLFALPVLLAAVLGPLLLALGTAATVTVALLADAWLSSIATSGEMTGRFLQAALTGLGLFVVAYLANQLAMRLARQERLARGSATAARVQTQVNQLVIDTLSDGILVVDSNGVVRTANPAARSILGPRTSQRNTSDQLGLQPGYEGLLPQTPFVLASQAHWQPLADIANATLIQRAAQRAEVTMTDFAGTARKLMARTQLVASQHDGQDSTSLCVVFLEDLREMEARLRTEKLAAMGRMSAAVAHEIRNPLAAISQANALLAEDLQDAGHLKLTQMVQHNAKRLARIVDDVLDVSRAQPALASPWLLADVELAVTTVCKDWAAQNNCVHQLYVPVLQGNTSVVFEEEHLRRVLVNLLDNALRYASKEAHTIQINLELAQAPGDSQPVTSALDSAPALALRLSVWSQAAAIEQGVQRHLFEPFFSSESRSSGLGLYICRELCARHGASIGYRRSESPHRIAAIADHKEAIGNEFFVHFALAQVWMPSLPTDNP